MAHASYVNLTILTECSWHLRLGFSVSEFFGADEHFYPCQTHATLAEEWSGVQWFRPLRQWYDPGINSVFTSVCVGLKHGFYNWWALNLMWWGFKTAPLLGIIYQIHWIATRHKHVRLSSTECILIKQNYPPIHQTWQWTILWSYKMDIIRLFFRDLHWWFSHDARWCPFNGAMLPIQRPVACRKVVVFKDDTQRTCWLGWSATGRYGVLY